MNNQKQSRQQIIALIRQWPQSGLEQKEFCRKHSISYHTFKYYRKREIQKEKNKADSTSFVPVKIKQPRQLYALTITYPNGVSICVEDAITPDQLKDLIHIF